VKSLNAFSQMLLLDLGERCHVSTGRDFKTVTARVEHEGESFYTITLPKFGKDLQKGLDLGFIDRSMFHGFVKHGELPRFLGGFLDLVFDRKTGRLLDQPSIDAIASLHQFTSVYGKFFSMCSEERTEKAIKGFIECEQDVKNHDRMRTEKDLLDFKRISSMLFAEVFTEVDRQVYYGELLPKHGPGATAEKLTANSKYSQKEWTERLEAVFPLGEYLFPNWGWYHQFQGIDILEPGKERPVRVIPVPKTQKTPRLIAIEPTCMQYTQQAIHLAIVEEIQRKNHLKALLGNLDQGPNRDLAKVGSITGTLATLDLSEASDRVSNQLVRTMIADWPHLHEAIDASRSRSADVPGFGVKRLSKFASMGSALCFDIEGMVFTTLVFLGIERALNRRLTNASIKRYVGRVRVYGDDLIVPVDTATSVVETLEAFGLKVNQDKSFWTGKFRESCGGDFYAGANITPVRMRRKFPASRKHVDEIVSTVSFRNLLFVKGYERCVAYLDSMLEKLLPVYPEVPWHSHGLGRWTWEPIHGSRIHPSRHTPQIRACVKKDRLRKDVLSEHGALMKWFLKRDDLPFIDRNHLLRAGRPVASDIKPRWVDLEHRSVQGAVPKDVADTAAWLAAMLA
jgi:hypothetical protein